MTTDQKPTAADCLKRIKAYIERQYEDIPTWESSQVSKDARIDELQCIDTLVTAMLDKQNSL